MWLTALETFPWLDWMIVLSVCIPSDLFAKMEESNPSDSSQRFWESFTGHKSIVWKYKFLDLF